MKCTVATFLGVIFASSTRGAKSQVIIGKDLCACSPSIYEFTLDFDRSCPPANLTGIDTVDNTSCVITAFGDPNVTDLVPVSVQSIDILELGQGLRVLIQEKINANLSNGDSFVYTSLSAFPEEIKEPDEVPRAIQINIVGMNQFNESLINVYLITFTNACDDFPLLLEGQSAGWTVFSRLNPPLREICPSLRNITEYDAAPSASPTTNHKDTDAPTAASLFTSSPTDVTKGSIIPSASPDATMAPTTTTTTKAPTYRMSMSLSMSTVLGMYSGGDILEEFGFGVPQVRFQPIL
jgi:hypothetical protein